MPQEIRIKRRLSPGTAGEPTAGTLVAGELAYNENGNTLWIGGHGTPAAIHLLNPAPSAAVIVGPTGPTPPAGGDLWYDTTVNILKVYNAGTSTWVNIPQPGTAPIEVNAPITGNGTTASRLGLDVATNPEIVTGTDAIKPITTAGLFSAGALGQAVTAANLGTSNIPPGVVPAIHELSTRITSLTGAIIVVGSYNATNHQIVDPRPPASLPPYSLVTGGALPAMPNPAMRGWLWLVSQAGLAAAPAPAVQMAVGDWVVCNGTDYVHLSMGLTSIAASNVSTVVPTAPDAQPGWTNVQLFLNGLHTQVHNLTTTWANPTGTGTFGRTSGGDWEFVGRQHYGATAPTGTAHLADLWLNTTAGVRSLTMYNGAAWESVTDGGTW